MQHYSLHVKKWIAWAPGLHESGDWSNWTSELAWESINTQPDTSFLSPAVRRRLSVNSRLAINVAQACIDGEQVSSGVFCSRHGECKRTLTIFEAVAGDAPVSPIQFSQSVHNVASGLFSTERQLQVPFASIAAGPASGEQGFIEAAAQIACGQESVLWVMADDRQAPPFKSFAPVPEFPFAVAMLLGRFPDYPLLTLERQPAKEVSRSESGTDNLLALLTGQDHFRIREDTGWRWTWQHA